jgi:hypothetical protein
LLAQRLGQPLCRLSLLVVQIGRHHQLEDDVLASALPAT